LSAQVGPMQMEHAWYSVVSAAKNRSYSMPRRITSQHGLSIFPPII
jgi:hypothetical protein